MLLPSTYRSRLLHLVNARWGSQPLTFDLCEVAPQLEPVRMESHEIANGMWPIWINLHQAISHNEAVMQRREPSMGQ